MHPDDEAPLAEFNRGSGVAGVNKTHHTKTAGSVRERNRRGIGGAEWTAPATPAGALGRRASAFPSAPVFPRGSVKVRKVSWRKRAIRAEKRVAPEPAACGASKSRLRANPTGGSVGPVGDEDQVIQENNTNHSSGKTHDMTTVSRPRAF